MISNTRKRALRKSPANSLLCLLQGQDEGPVTSWMAVEVEIAPVQVSDDAAAKSALGAAAAAMEVRRQHADIAACIVAVRVENLVE